MQNSRAAEHDAWSRKRIVLWLCFVVLVIVAFFKSPYILLEGRFWAEEGMLHFQRAYSYAWYQPLLFVDQHAGYLLFFGNLSAIAAAKLTPLSAAPLVTAWLSLLPLLLTWWLILCFRNELFDNILIRFLVALSLVVGPFVHPEVWLNTINSQVYWGIFTFFTLFLSDDETWSRKRRWSIRGALTMAGLTGLYSVALWPLFMLKFLLRRSREAGWQLGILSVCALIQAAVVLASKSSGHLTSTRLLWPTLSEVVINTAVQDIGKPILGEDLSLSLGLSVWHTAFGTDLTITEAVMVGIASMAILLLLFSLIRAERWRAFAMALLAFLGIWVFTLIGSIGTISARYAVMPGFIVLCCVALFATHARHRITKAVFLALAGFSTVVGIQSFSDGKHLNCVGCPSWRDEVRDHLDTNYFVALETRGFRVPLEQGTHVLEIEFLDDADGRNSGRHLLVESVEIDDRSYHLADAKVAPEDATSAADEKFLTRSAVAAFEFERQTAGESGIQINLGGHADPEPPRYEVRLDGSTLERGVTSWSIRNHGKERLNIWPYPKWTMHLPANAEGQLR